MVDEVKWLPYHIDFLRRVFRCRPPLQAEHTRNLARPGILSGISFAKPVELMNLILPDFR